MCDRASFATLFPKCDLPYIVTVGPLSPLAHKKVITVLPILVGSTGKNTAAMNGRTHTPLIQRLQRYN